MHVSSCPQVWGTEDKHRDQAYLGTVPKPLFAALCMVFYPRKGYFINSLFRIQTKKYIQLKSEAPLHPSLTTNRTPPPESNHTVLSTLRTFLHICRHIRKFINNEQGTPYIHFCDLLLSFNSLSWISPWRYIKETSPAFLPLTSQHSEG